MKTAAIVIVILAFLGYSIFGTEGNVEEIKRQAPLRIEDHKWDVLGYEGYERGSWMHHGGKVWYHVAEKDNPNVRYRVYFTLWNGELHAYYGPPEVVSNVQVKVEK